MGIDPDIVGLQFLEAQATPLQPGAEASLSLLDGRHHRDDMLGHRLTSRTLHRGGPGSEYAARRARARAVTAPPAAAAVCYTGGVSALEPVVRVVDHPLVQDALTSLRDRGTDTDRFRRNARLLTLFLSFEVLADLPTREVSVTTPLEETTARRMDRSVIFVPVLRAGLGMLDAISDLVPGSRVGFVGLERDEETAIARAYYQKLPERLAEGEVIILDPMLATGGSAIATIELLKEQRAHSIRLACIVAAPEGIREVNRRHPDVRIVTASVDRQLNERKYILPGLGDFGDRYFGTD